MNRVFCPLACIVLFLAGCGHRHAENVDSDDAGKSLGVALEAWKGGKTPAELEGQQPSIIMNDMDWAGGAKLLDYKLNDAGSLDGRQMRWVAQLKLQDKAGKVSERKATYIIDTIPRIVIVRDTFAR
jgi:hypothetical protein